jgi:hypothetical protein
MPLGDCSNDSVFAISTTEMSNSRIEPFEINIPLEEVDRLKRKLKDTRLPPREIVPNAGDKYGPTYEWGNNLYETSEANGFSAVIYLYPSRRHQDPLCACPIKAEGRYLSDDGTWLARKLL